MYKVNGSGKGSKRIRRSTRKRDNFGRKETIHLREPSEVKRHFEYGHFGKAHKEVNPNKQ